MFERENIKLYKHQVHQFINKYYLSHPIDGVVIHFKSVCVKYTLQIRTRTIFKITYVLCISPFKAISRSFTILQEQ